MRTVEKRALKATIKEKEQIAMDMVKNYDPIEIAKQPEEAQVELKRIYTDNLALARDAVFQARTALKMFRMNPTGSSHFSWEPHMGTNRRQRRFMRKQRGLKK